MYNKVDLKRYWQKQSRMMNVSMNTFIRNEKTFDDHLSHVSALLGAAFNESI